MIVMIRENEKDLNDRSDSDTISEYHSFGSISSNSDSEIIMSITTKRKGENNQRRYIYIKEDTELLT